MRAAPFLLAAACSVYDESLLGAGGAGGEAASTTTTATTSTTGTGGASTTTTTTTSTSSAGGGGGGVGGSGGSPDCGAPGDCPGEDTACATRTCEGGVCGLAFVAAGTPLDAPMQTAGDCQIAACDGAGETEPLAEPSDTPDDANECTTDTCNGGTPLFTPKASGAGCAEGGGHFCNADGACVECVVDNDCATHVCTDMFACAPAECGDSVKNGAETAVDCGGVTCPPCATGSACLVSSDCIGGSCPAGLCVPTCTDTVKNQGETAVDCGGLNCGPCAVGQACVVGADCADGVCAGNVCAEPSCADGVKNGTETAVDCGGASCDGCPTNHLVLNEVEYDEVGSDTAEYVEIYNNTGAPVSLANIALVLVDGSNSATYMNLSLAAAGTLADKQYLVVGTAGLAVPVGALQIDLTTTVQNGMDGIALVDKATSTLLDALSYEGPMVAANVTGIAGTVSLVEGTVLPNAVADSNTNFRSLCRLPNATDTDNAAGDWQISHTPTPGAANVP